MSNIILALVRVFHMRGCMLHTVPVLCGSPHVIFLFHLHTLARLRAQVFPREKPRLVGCTVQSKTTFLNINLTVLSSLSFSIQFKCCGWNNYTDWSWNLYFNCTHENPSSERCAVPYSCCTPVPGEVRAFLCGLTTYTGWTN